MAAVTFIVFIISYQVYAAYSVKLLWLQRYDNKGIDEVNGMAINEKGEIYVTGYSEGVTTDFDYCTIKYSSSGAQKWVKRYNGPGSPGFFSNNDEARALALDKWGNVIVTGTALNWGFDYTTIKYDSDGNQLWLREYNGTQYGDFADGALAVASDENGNIYVTGYSLPGYEFDKVQIVTIKYDSLGNQLWVKTYADHPGYGNVVAVDQENNIIIGGYGGGEEGNEWDYIIIKYSANGDRLWDKTYKGPGNGNDIISALAIDKSNNVYVTGWSKGVTSDDYATIKYDKNGNLQWAKRYDSGSNDWAQAIAVSDENVYVAGSWALLKYSNQGKLLWTQKFGWFSTGFAIVLDQFENIYVAGNRGNDNWDAIVQKYSSNGKLLWESLYNGPANDHDTAMKIALDKFNNIFIAGDSNAADSKNDYFIAKYAQPPMASLSAPTIATDISSTASFSINWVGTDSNGSGIAGYQIQYRRNDTAGYSNWKTWVTTKSATFTGKPGYTYYFRVRAKDNAGNSSNWSYGKTIVPYDDTSLTYSKGWTSIEPVYGYMNTYKYSTKQGEWATLTFTGKSVTLIAPKGLYKGRVDVYIRDRVNGVWQNYYKVKTIDLYSETYKNRVPFAIKSWDESSTHQIKFVVAGTKSLLSKGYRTDIDGIAVLK